MSNEFDEVEKRLKGADVEAPELGASILEQATRAPKRNLPNPASAKFALAGVAGLAAVSLFAVSLPSANQPLITLASDGSSTRVAQESSMPTDSIAIDSLPGWLNPYEYKTGPNLSNDPGEGVVYELVIEGNPTKRLREFAELFDQQGSVELEQWSTEYFPSYKLETDEAYFSLYWHGSGMINYSSKRNWLAEECYLTEDELIDSDIQPQPRAGCEPLPTVEMPSEQVLALEAFELIKRAGYQGQLEDISVERYEWGASAFATTSVDGIQTAIEWYISWDQTGQISNVSGHLAKAVNIGVFNTISPSQAVSRISEGYWFGAAPRSFYEYSIQESSMSISEEAPVSDSDKADQSQAVEEDIEMIPVEPLPEPGELEIVELTVESSTSVTLLIEDSQGTGWLVPGYLLQTDQDWFESIVALEDGVIATSE